MTRVFLATLGQRPEAITLALDALLTRFSYERVGILHTEPQHSGIAGALQALRPVLTNDYADMAKIYHEIQFENGEPLIDITNQHSAEAYYRGLLSVLQDYIVQEYTVHLLVAGGRKAMSIYATLAASMVFSSRDYVWTVLSSPELVRQRTFHARGYQKNEVQPVRLPIMPSRFTVGTLTGMDVDDIIAVQRDPREKFLADLSEEEMRLVELLRDHPRATNKDLAKMLKKSASTIDSQFTRIYQRMETHFVVKGKHKKHILREIIQ